MIDLIRKVFGSFRWAAGLTAILLAAGRAAIPFLLEAIGWQPSAEDLAKIDAGLVWAVASLVALIVGDSVRPIGKPVVALIFAIALPAASLLAEDVVISGDGQRSVTRYFRIDYDAAGGATVVPLPKVIRFGEPVPPPTDPQPPTGPVLTAFEKEIIRLTQLAVAAGGSKTTAARVSAVYSLVSSGVADGSIAPASALPAVKAGTDAALLGQADANAWKPWRDAVSAALVQFQQEGGLQTKEQYAATLRSIEKGLNTATGFVGIGVIGKLPAENLGILDGIDLVKLMEFVGFILTLLKTLGILK